MEGTKQPWYKIMEIRRVTLDLTQEQAAAACEVPLGTYGRWERGTHKPMRAHRKAIAQAFQMEEDELFED